MPKIENLPGLDQEGGVETLKANPGDPDVWAEAMMNSLALWHDADLAEVRAWCAAMLAAKPLNQ